MRQILFFVPMAVGTSVVLGAARLLSYQVSFVRALIAVVLLRVAEILLEAVLGPVIGDWKLLADFVGYVLIARGVLWLSIGRSVTFASIYFILLALAYYTIGLLHYHHILVL